LILNKNVLPLTYQINNQTKPKKTMKKFKHDVAMELMWNVFSDRSKELSTAELSEQIRLAHEEIETLKAELRFRTTIKEQEELNLNN